MTGDSELAVDGSLGECQDARASFAWFIRLSNQDRTKPYVIAVLSVGVAFVGWFVFHSPLLGLVGGSALLGSTAEYWLGVNYLLTEESATARCGFSATTLDWSKLKRIIVSGQTIRLSPLDRPSQMEVFRGVLLRTTPENHPQVLDWVHKFGPKDARYLGC